MRSQTPSPVRRLLGRRLGAPAGAGRWPADPVTTAADLAAAGFAVALEHRPAADAGDPTAALRELVARVAAAGIADRCELTVPVDRLGAADAVAVARTAAGAGLGVALTGAPPGVDAVTGDLPAPVVVVPADHPGAEQRCRALADARVRLAAGRGAAADLAFVRCLNVLMAGAGRPAVGTTDPRLVAIAGERAAWNERTPDSWEYVMPWRVRTEQQRRLVAGGYGVRVVVPSGERAALVPLRRLAGLR
ncbi:hypothetical protein [Geodermatophilus sp. SYSU D00079]